MYQKRKHSRSILKGTLPQTKFFKSSDSLFEVIYSKDSRISYGNHCHSSSFVTGIILSGGVIIKNKDGFRKYGTGEIFSIVPFSAHSITAAPKYSMLTLSVKSGFFKKSSMANKVEAFGKSLVIKKIITQNELKILLKNIEAASFEPHEHRPDLQKADKFAYIRTFKKISGMPPHGYEILKKVRKAQSMLPEMSVTETALAAGFYDQSHFIRHFKKIVGLTPTCYKNSYTEI